MDKKHKIVIYRFTGRQGFFSIPKKWCEECDMLINLVKNTVSESGKEDEVELKILPWWLFWFIPLFKYRTIHAPMLTINDKLISAGIVPEKEAVLRALGADI